MTEPFSIYSIGGVIVPDFVVEEPEKITLELIERETVADVRKIMLDVYNKRIESRHKEPTMIDNKMRLDNLESDLAGDYGSIAFRSDLEHIAGELFGRNRKYEAFNLLTCYGRLMECNKSKKAKIVESMLLFLKDARRELV